MQGERAFKSAFLKKGSRTFLAIPFDPDEVWGAKARHSVAGTIAGFGVRGSLTPDGLPVGPAWFRDRPVDPSAEVEVVLWPEGPQSADLAPDLAAAFLAEPEAAAFFDGLATFYRNNFMRWIGGAKRPETRANRIREAVAMLKNGERM